MKAKYVHFYTDFGFKKLFGGEPGKNLLIDFLNQILPEDHKITGCDFKHADKLGGTTFDRKDIIRIHCHNHKGETFFVEMQKEKLKLFRDKNAFFSTFPIKKQAEEENWDLKLNPVYCVAILDFVFGDDRPQKDYFNNVQLKDQYCQLFYDKLTYIFLEMPRFQKTEQELETHFDKWLYFLKHLESFEDIPEILEEDVFLKGFEIAELSNFDARQMDAYEKSLMAYRDLKGAFDNSYEEGMEEGHKIGVEEGHKTGLEEGQNKEKQETARRLKAMGVSIEIIMEATGQSRDAIEQLP